MCEWVLCFTDYSQPVCAVSEMTDCLPKPPKSPKLLPQRCLVLQTPSSSLRKGQGKSSHAITWISKPCCMLPCLYLGWGCCVAPQSPLPFALLLQAHCREQVCKQWCYRAWGSAIAHCLMELWVLLRQGTLLMVMEYLIRWQTVANTELWVLTGRQLPREKWGAQVGACGWG